MTREWMRAIATLAAWLGVAALLWALGAWLVFAAMGDAIADHAIEAIARAALLVALVVGVVVARGSPIGYLAVAVASAVCAAGYALAAVAGAPVGVMTAVVFAVSALTAVAAFVRWRMGGSTRAPAEPAGPVSASRAGPPGRSPVETAVASGLAIGGLLVLGRAGLELVQGLAELPGASEHWAGDVVLWLVLVLPIPVLAGATMLAAARWVWRRRAGTRGAAVVGVAAVGLAVTWVVAEASWFLGQGSYWGSLDDPLLWAPVALLVGVAAGAVVLVGSSVQARGHRV